MYDYIFPMKTYMGLGFVYAGEGLTKFIPKPTDVLDETKETIFSAMINLINSNDYTFLPDVLANQDEALAIRSLGGTTGKDPDMTKEILKLIYETMFLVLKNFVEITDPAVIIAKAIIDATNAAVTAALAIAETALNTAKAAHQGAKLAQKNIQQSLGISIQTVSSVTNSIKNTLAVPADPANPDSPLIKDLITIDIQGDDPDQWTVECDDRLLEPDGEFYKKLKEQGEDFASLSGFLNKIFQSPYLLPALWGAMLPSMIPYFGGLVPPPIVIGPPSTVPGMIYIALLLIDAAEEKIHDDVFDPEDPCIEEL